MAKFTAVLPSLTDDAGKESTEATVSFVYVSVGDSVQKEADLVELVTDKATFNMPSPEAGKITALLVEEGDTVRVGDPICEMDI